MNVMAYANSCYFKQNLTGSSRSRDDNTHKIVIDGLEPTQGGAALPQNRERIDLSLG